MKLKDIVINNSKAKKAETIKAIQSKQFGIKYDAAREEVLALLRAEDAGLIANCPFLADDERELIHCILKRVRDDQRYQPSVAPMQFVVDVNSRVWTSLGAPRA